jgi:hypothetical protein
MLDLFPILKRNDNMPKFESSLDFELIRFEWHIPLLEYEKAC